LKGRNNLGEQNVGGRIIEKCILRKCHVKLQTTFIWLRIRASGSCEHANEPKIGNLLTIHGVS
jgi:hypothetical protein